MAIYEQIIEATDYIKQKISRQPKVAIICGSGLGSLANSIEKQVIIPYNEIPHFAISSVKGHKGQLVFGELNGMEVVAMQGRFHFYEGYTMQEVTFPVRVLKRLCVEILIVTNAAGGLNPEFSVGDIMVIKDHINLMPNPLIGKNDERLGERFPSMSGIYNKELRELFMKTAHENRIKVREGVYLGLTGPSFETNAENRFFQKVGADCVGMSTVPEVIVAAHEGLKVFAASVISNIFIDKEGVISKHDDVLSAVSKASFEVEKLIKNFIFNLHSNIL
ncbi:MAG: purine-nucleoside phosphorylase [Bacteroidales bacterium]|jgi:purine-nucleoside phosphorylase|nr:purine-nucleoside phosphorylase [Bacteroidales bacterium]